MNLTDAIPLILTNLTFVSAIMVMFWVVSRIIGDVSFIDAVWGLGFVLVAWISYIISGGGTLRHSLITVLVTIWGLRLAFHLFFRWRREGEDPRYAAFIGRQKMNPALFTLLFIFLLQGVLLTFISLPVQLGQIGAAPLGIAASIGVLLWTAGFLFETIGDWQLFRFRNNSNNDGKVLDTGLWRYTRHPNYFGDALLWWGLYLIAAETPLGVWSFAGPAFLTFILLKWSGVPLLEKRLKESRHGYGDYIRRTSAFIPWLPKKN